MASDTKLTLAKLAELAGVSTSTASRALKDNPLIKKETRLKIQALAKEVSYDDLEPLFGTAIKKASAGSGTVTAFK